MKLSKRNAMGRLAVFFVLTALIMACLAGCGSGKSEGKVSGNGNSINEGSYVATAVTGYPLNLKIKNGKFYFSDLASNTLEYVSGNICGSYSISDNELKLVCDSSNDVFVFTISEDKLYLDKSVSSSLNVIKSKQNFEKIFPDEVCFTLLEQ